MKKNLFSFLLASLYILPSIAQQQVITEVSSTTYHIAEVRENNTVTFASTSLELHGKDGSTNQETFVRFEGITLPEGAVITDAYINFYGRTASSTSTTISIKGEVGSSAAYPTSTLGSSTGVQIKGRPYTVGSVSWITTGCVARETYSSPDITSLLLEMFPEGISNANPAFRFTGNGQGNFTTYSNGTAGYRPVLVINYWSLYDTSTRVVGLSSDDGRESASGTVTLTAAYLQLGGRSDGNTQAVRFSNVTIPADAEIEEAYIEFYSYTTSPAATSNIYTEIGDASTYSTTSKNISSRTYSENKIPWFTEALTSNNTLIRTPDLKNIMDENRLKGWQSGQSIAFKFEGLTLNEGADVRSYDGGASYRPQLVVKYINNGNGPNIVLPQSGQYATSVAVGSSDARENNSGSIYLTESYLRLGGRTDGNTQAVHFNKVAIPANAKIKDAYIEFYAYASSAAANMEIYSQIGNAATYTTGAKNISQRPYSETKVSWSQTALSDYQKIRTPNLQSIIDENRLSGWEPEQGLAFLFKGLSGNNGTAVRSYEASALYRPRLVIEYDNDGGPSIDGESDPANITQLYVNELGPQGSADQKEDWIELYNNHDFALFITGGIYISNKSGNRTLCELKNIFLAPKGFAILIADEKPEAGDNHLSFDLKNSGTTIYLSRKVNGQTILQDEFTYPAISYNQSYGRVVDGANDAVEFITPTYKASNEAGFQKRYITFSQERGIYPAGFALNISAQPGLTIRYTLDGKYPSRTSGTIYSAPIPISKTTTVKAIAYDSIGNSEIIAHSYILQDNYANETRNGNEWQYKSSISAAEYAQAITQFPIVSISTGAELPSKLSDGSVNWVNGSVEYIENHVSGHANFFSNALTGIFGNESARYFNPGIKFKFHRDAGVKKPDYSFFEAYPGDVYKIPEKVQTIELKEGQDGPGRNVYGSGFTRFSEKITMNLQKEMGKYALETRYVNLFVNGKYRGVKTMRNDFKQQNFEELFGDDGDNYTKMVFNDSSFDTGEVEAGEGDVAVLNEIKALAAAKDLQGFKQKVDIEDLIKCQILFMFIDCENEIDAIVHNNAPQYTKAKFIINDTDGAFNGAERTPTVTSTTLNSRSMAGSGGNYKYKWGSRNSREGAGKLFAKFMDMGTNPNPNAGNLEFKTLVKDYVLESFGPIAGKAGYGTDDVPLSVANVTKKINESVAELDLVYKLDAAFYGFAANTYTLWKNTVYPRIIGQVPERVSFSLAKWNEWGMAHDLEAVGLNAESEVTENTPVFFTNPNIDAQVYYTLDGSDPMGNDGTVSSEANLYDASTGLILSAGSYKIVTRAFKTNDWGPKTAAQKLVVNSAFSGKLVISGINHTPLTDGDAEFLMLTNAGNAILDLSGYAISDAVVYTFPAGVSLEINETLILVKKLDLVPGYSYLQKYQWSSGSLSKGETITFVNPAGQEVDQVSYLSAAPWTTAANGTGYYLKLKDVNLDNALPESWEAELIETPEPEIEPLLRSASDFTAINVVSDDKIQLKVYPNPVHSELNVQIENARTINMIVSIYSLNGKLMLTEKLNSNRNLIRVSSLPQGFYVLRLADQENAKTTKVVRFIKQ
jgi:hypothetical protein